MKHTRPRTSSYPSIRSPFPSSRLHHQGYSQGAVEIHNLNTGNPILAKNYNGYRIVYSPNAEGGSKFTSYVSRAGEAARSVSADKLERFKKDAIEAAKKDEQIRTFLQRHSFPE